jgi:predicted Zn-dependent protease
MPHPTLRPLEQSFQKTERIYIRLGLKVFLGLVLLIGLIWGGRVLFLRMQEQRLMTQALASFDKGDNRWASIAARRVFELNPQSAEACRLLAKIGEKSGQPSAVEWRRQVVAILPSSVEDSLALAKTALRFGDIGTAERTLEKIAGSAADVAGFHEARAQLAVTKKDPAAAQRDFEQAVRLEPQNKVYRLNLAVFRLQSSSPEERTEASKLLQELMDDPAVRVPAARALRDYAVQRQDTPAVLDIAALLHSYPEADFRDRIFFAQVLHQLDHPDFARRLDALQEEAATDPGKLFDLLTWMAGERLTLVALDWVKRLPRESILHQPVPLAVANCYAAIKDWAGLQQWCKNANWGPNDFLRRAYLARASREQGQPFAFQTEWAAALKEAGSDGGKIQNLAQEAAKWGWKSEAADLLWMLTKDAERQHAVLAALYQHYMDTRETGELYRIVTRLVELKPDDHKALNNYAQLSLLLNLNTQRAHDIAERLYQADPSNAVIASTYAYSLHTKGKPKQALEIMDRLPEEKLREPAIAAYYGVILAAAGDKSKAQEFLALGATATLLPEEKTLVARTSDNISRR